MKEVFVSIILIVITSTVAAQSPFACLQYINSLSNMSKIDQPAFAKAMAPYLIFSGKILDDMGFPDSCLKNPSYNYWRIQLGLIDEQDYELTMYYGLCFTNVCSTQTLNQQSGTIRITIDFFIEFLLKNMTNNYQINQIEFQDVDMNARFTAGSIIVSILISLFILARMASSFIKWGRLCLADSEDQAISIELEQLQQKQAGRMPQHHLTFLQKFSLTRAFSTLFVQQQTNKIMAFSLFKLFSLPFIVFGYLFYLGNYGAYNYFSFNQQIYATFYSKIACFAYYLPDIFFFISGYLYSRKLIRLDQVSQDKQMGIISAFAKKMTKLYPLYLAVIFIYWFVTPSLHAGPLWDIYTEQTQQCNQSWFLAFLMIDNWFVDGCFSFSWYVQLQFQFLLILSIIFLVYGRKRIAANIILISFTITAFILLFVLSEALPYSIQTTISDHSKLYFQAFYSHLFFYLFGAYLAFIFEKQSVRSFVKNYFSTNIPVFTSFVVVAFALIILIISRPDIWNNALGLQLAFCRIGIMLSFLIFFLPNLVDSQVHLSYIHKLSKLTYSIILFIGIIVSCYFWGLDTFAYVDGMNILSSSVTNLIISIAVGGFVGVVFDFIPFTFEK